MFFSQWKTVNLYFGRISYSVKVIRPYLLLKTISTYNMMSTVRKICLNNLRKLHIYVEFARSVLLPTIPYVYEYTTVGGVPINIKVVIQIPMLIFLPPKFQQKYLNETFLSRCFWPPNLESWSSLHDTDIGKWPAPLKVQHVVRVLNAANCEVSL